MTQLQLLLFSGPCVLRDAAVPQRTLTITLDTDWVWRKALPAVATRIERMIGAAQAMMGHEARRVSSLALKWVGTHYGVDSRLARTWSTRGMALWVLVLMLGYLVLYYV